MIVLFKVEIDVPESVLFDSGYSWPYRNEIMAAMMMAGNKKAREIESRMNAETGMAEGQGAAEAARDPRT